MPKSYTVDDDYNDSRLDKWFKNKIINLPHSLLEKILRQNKVKVNKKKTKSSYRLQTGDLIEINSLKPENPFFHQYHPSQTNNIQGSKISLLNQKASVEDFRIKVRSEAFWVENQ